MTGMHALWMPILLSAVAVFVVSSVIHMFLPWHKSDYVPVPREDEVMQALLPFAIPPGDYMVPHAGSTEVMRSPVFKAKLDQGPNMIVTVLPNGMPNMTRSLVLWFVYLIVVGAFAAFVSGRALPPGAPADRVRLFAGVTAFAAYSLALWQMSIWYRRSMTTTIKATIDSVVYAAITAWIFAWLWPQ